MYLPHEIGVVHVEQHDVSAELRLAPAAARLPPSAQVPVHVLKALQALGQVLRVEALVEGGWGLLHQACSTVGVEAGARLHQGHGT